MRKPLPYFTIPQLESGQELTSNVTPGSMSRLYEKPKNYILEGDIFQVVLSQRLSRRTSADPFSVYRALRRVNPSPYMFFLNLGGDPPLHIIGSSPEVLVRLQDGKAEVRPIAGTRPRGATREEDHAAEGRIIGGPQRKGGARDAGGFGTQRPGAGV